MRWATLSHIHLDRVASLWLVIRFVDPVAEFEFVDWGLDGQPPSRDRLKLPPDATPIGVPGVELGMHDAEGSCFAKVMRVHQLDDPALIHMERIVASGVGHALGTPPPTGQTEEERGLGAALDLLGAALGVLFDDAEHLERATTIYDAVYMHCRLSELQSAIAQSAPRVPPLRTPYLRDALAHTAAGATPQA
jgi:hypothetical protein